MCKVIITVEHAWHHNDVYLKVVLILQEDTYNVRYVGHSS